MAVPYRTPRLGAVGGRTQRINPKWALAAMVLLGCGTSGSPHGDRELPPHVILITLDTVRADRWGRALTPNFDRLAERSDRYPRAVASAPWTLPSHASMFTGRTPSEHGAVSFEVDAFEDNAHPLHSRNATIAEALADEGYRCGALVANTVYLSPRHGLHQGFDDWRVQRVSGHEISRSALAWLDVEAGPERPVFLFLNYMDAHRPYNVGSPAGAAASAALLNRLIEQVMVRGEAPGALAKEVADQYERALQNLDEALGLLFDGLAARDLLDDTLVIVTSDHGEAFGEHGLVEHSKGVIESLVRVPMIVKRPRQAFGRDCPERASSVDVAGLIALATGVGVERFPRRPGTHRVWTENRFSRPHDLLRFGARFRRTQRALYDGNLKLVLSSRGPARLFDVAIDPGELRDLSTERPADLARMHAQAAAPSNLGSSFIPWAGPWLKPTALSSRGARELSTLGYGALPDTPSASEKEH